MSETFKNKNVKRFGNRAKNIVIVGSLIGAMVTSPLCLSTTSNNTIDSFFSRKTNLCVEDYCTIDSFDTSKQYDCVTIKNSNINDMSFFNNLTIDTIEFENCDLSSCEMNLPSSVTNVSFTNCNMDNFKGLSNNSNIEFLYINSCNVSGLEGIEKLENLYTLIISYVGIESIDEIANLKNLNSLTLLQTCVNSIEPLKNTNIETLDISDSLNIKDISTIKYMNNLRYFYARNCQMCLSEDILKYISDASINSDVTQDDLKIQSEVKDIASEIFNDSMNKEEKIKATVNYVVNKMEYDHTGATDFNLLSEYNSNALKYALQGNGCCRNYTALTTALLQEANIYTYEILNDYHIWSLIEIEDEYYWLDSTLIDLENYGDVSEHKAYMTLNFNDINTSKPCSVPETYYNKTNDSIESEYENPNSNVNDIDYTIDASNSLNSSTIISYLSSLHIPLGALAGIAIALNLGFKAKKKNINNEKQKIIKVKEPINIPIDKYNININDITADFNNDKKNISDDNIQKYINQYKNIENKYKNAPSNQSYYDSLLDDYGFINDEKKQNQL